jgi:CheY-like chemotaxis protein
MTKIMLVEDDTNLSEIYRARLEAEGYQIVSAKDGEEALALAVKEKPELIICDIMMPKISGFEMLDILRGTQGVQNTKVIMMSALGQAEDKARAAALGADRYLVKSQVTLEDVVKTVKEVLATDKAIPAATPPASTPAPTEPTPTPTPVAPSPPSPSPPTPTLPTPTPSPPSMPVVSAPVVPEPISPPAVPTPTPAAFASPARSEGDVNIPGKKVIQPLSDLHAKPDLDALVAREELKELAEKEKSQATAQTPVNSQPSPAPTSSYLGNNPSQPSSTDPNEESSAGDPNSIAL